MSLATVGIEHFRREGGEEVNQVGVDSGAFVAYSMSNGVTDWGEPGPWELL
jgi:hypothetical protein